MTLSKAKQALKISVEHGELDPITSEKITKGEIKLVDFVSYLRVTITGQGGINDLLTENTTLADGVSSFSGNKFDVHNNFIVERVSVGYATNAAKKMLPILTIPVKVQVFPLRCVMLVS